MKVKLTVADRYNIRTFFPLQGNLKEQIQVKSILNKTEITSEEIEEFQIVEAPNGSVEWNTDSAKEIEADFTTGEVELLNAGVDSKDSAKEIQLYMVDLAVKIKEWAGCPVK